MSKIKWKCGLKFTIILLGFFFWGLSIYYGREQMKDLNSVGIRFEDKMLSALMFDTMWEEEKETGEIKSLVTYETKGKIIVQNTLGQEFVSKGYNVLGDMSLILPSQLLSGYYPVKEEKNQCIVSLPMARTIWGSENVLDLKLHYNKKIYSVSGVINSNQEMIWFQNEDNLATFSNLEIEFNNGDNSGYRATEFLSKYGIYGEYAIIDAPLVCELMKIVYLLPGMLLLLIIIVRSFRCYKNYKGTPLYKGSAALIIILLVIIIVKINAFGVHIPDSLIPNRWSDFEFYTMKWNEIKKMYFNIQQLPLQFIDIKIKYNMITSLFYSIISCLCVLKIRKMKVVKPINNAIYVLICCFVGLTLLRLVRVEIEILRAIILMPIIYLFVSTLIVKINGMTLTKD